MNNKKYKNILLVIMLLLLVNCNTDNLIVKGIVNKKKRIKEQIIVVNLNPNIKTPSIKKEKKKNKAIKYIGMITSEFARLEYGHSDVGTPNYSTQHNGTHIYFLNYSPISSSTPVIPNAYHHQAHPVTHSPVHHDAPPIHH